MYERVEWSSSLESSRPSTTTTCHLLSLLPTKLALTTPILTTTSPTFVVLVLRRLLRLFRCMLLDPHSAPPLP